jgi:hypothetical protein
MTIEENFDRLTAIVDSLAVNVAHHDDKVEEHNEQIGNLILIAQNQQGRIDNADERIAKLIEIAEQHKEEMAELRRAHA